MHVHTHQAAVLPPEVWLDAAEAMRLPFLEAGEVAERAMGFKPYVAHMENVQLLPHDWLLLGDHGLLIESLDPMMPLKPAKARHISAYANGIATVVLPEREVALQEPCVLLGNHSSHYHWLLYHLPRLIALERIPDLRSLRLIVGENLLPQQAESLRLMGIPESRLLRLAGDALYRCESLWVPSALTYRMHVHPVALRWLRRTFIGNDAPRPRGRRLFTSRRDAPMRYLLNEEELARAIAPFGFELIRCGELSFADQVRLFSEAEGVVGGTGSSLSNAVFVPSGSLMMELHNYDGARFLEVLCQQLGQRYERLIGKARLTVPAIRLHNCDFYVPPQALLGRLDALGLTRAL